MRLKDLTPSQQPLPLPEATKRSLFNVTQSAQLLFNQFAISILLKPGRSLFEKMRNKFFCRRISGLFGGSGDTLIESLVDFDFVMR